MTPKTLFQLAGKEVSPPRLADAVLILIDYQNEYLDGPLKLSGWEEAVARAERLLTAARRAGSRIIHVAHRGQPGGLFDRDHARGAFIERLAPLESEAVVEKTRPNGFSDTGLALRVGTAGAKLVIAGFMTHNCVSSTTRAALDLGYDITIAADACATRDLPSRHGVIRAADIQAAELAALADRHACVVDVDEVIG
ncbi:cysteine hydrolase family protein [Telmatospirillum siberiense]|uniref:Cysteine hydrolase n=1 Tax=Telmatospirillum siberiense TaxID=382514 RepID=A0A2N3PUH9_9PROT|nr:cysteine hydrolase family protein [Telmatospirillum siberiense]PKU24061.1 cysteine hydrolase [Telmatospirillum siberiense]